MENSTLGRKPGNDMKKNQGLSKMGNTPAYDQRDKDLDFNGQVNGSSQRPTMSKVNVNQWSGHMNDGRDVQFKQMPNRKGNIADQKDRTRRAPSTANNGQTRFNDPDSINMGSGPRDAGSTRPWAPAAGQNYRGNPDSIQDRQQYNNRGNKD